MESINQKILIVAPSAYPLGGVATWLDHVVPGLRKRGWDVTLGLVEGTFHDVGAYLDAHPDSQIVRIPYRTGTREGRVRQLIRAILRSKPDVVLTVHIADVISAIIRIREKSRLSPRLVSAVHALQPLHVACMGAHAGALDAVVCINKLTCEIIARQTSIEPNRIYYVPLGVRVEDIKPKPRKQKTDNLRIAYVGRLAHIDKRAGDIAAVVAELDRRGVPYEFLIAGGGPAEGRLRTQLAGARRVRFLGTLSREELNIQVYEKADVLLITSARETGPFVAWEAMANKVAVVASTFIGSGLERGLVDGASCLSFPVGNTVAAVDCLERLQDEALRDRLTTTGFNLVAERYSRTIAIEQCDLALAEIVAKPALPSVPMLDRTATAPAGRLDKFFGQKIGETIREMFGLTYEHQYPGEEWPEIDPTSGCDERAFWRLAASLDRKKCLASKRTDRCA